jgi:hypothetical protein
MLPGTASRLVAVDSGRITRKPEVGLSQADFSGGILPAAESAEIFRFVTNRTRDWNRRLWSGA